MATRGPAADIPPETLLEFALTRDLCADYGGKALNLDGAVPAPEIQLLAWTLGQWTSRWSYDFRQAIALGPVQCIRVKHGCVARPQKAPNANILLPMGGNEERIGPSYRFELIGQKTTGTEEEPVWPIRPRGGPFQQFH